MSRRHPRPRPAFSLVLGLALALAAAACGRGGDGTPTPPAATPDLTGARVMLLPARASAPAQLDPELAFWLTDRAAATDWVLPAELQRAVDRSPAWRMNLRALPRPIIDVGGSHRVGDPLYGALRQLGAVVDARYAVVPLAAAEAVDSAGTAMALGVAVVDIRAGRVLWMHTVRTEGNTDRGAAVASVAEKVARTLFP